MPYDFNDDYEPDIVKVQIGDCLHLELELYITADKRPIIYDRHDLEISIREFISSYLQKGGNTDGKKKNEG